MTAKFTKFATEEGPPKWAMFFHAGTDWLMTWQCLVELRKDPRNMTFTPTPFYVDTHIIHFCLELFAKSLICYLVPGFNPKESSHHTMKYIDKYKNLSPVFAEISNDPNLSALVREYEKTVDTRFGETSVMIESGDTEKMMSLIYKIRNELSSKTKLH